MPKPSILSLLPGKYWLAIFICFICLSHRGAAQAQPPAPEPVEQEDDCSVHDAMGCVHDILADQAHIWTSPLRLRPHDLKWLLPLGAAVGIAIHFDLDAAQAVGHARPFGTGVSRFGSPAVMAGTAIGLYGLGSWTHHDRVRETGLLGAEAVADTLLLTEGFKLMTARYRPLQDSKGDGDFWARPTLGASMPSGHAAASWAFAKVISSEFPDKKWLGFLAYTGATTVSFARVMAMKHFPSDVLVGSAFGYLTGAYVSRQRGHGARLARHLSLAPVFDGSSRSYGLSLNVNMGE